MDRIKLLSSLNLDKFIALDFETTGLDFESDRIIEVAAILFVDGLPSKRYNTLVNPGIPIPKLIEQITGITNEMVADSPKEKDIIDDLFKFIGDYPLVAHKGTAEAKSGARKYAIYLLGAAKAFLVVAIILTYNLTGTLEFSKAGIFPTVVQSAHQGLLYVIFVNFSTLPTLLQKRTACPPPGKLDPIKN